MRYFAIAGFSFSALQTCVGRWWGGAAGTSERPYLPLDGHGRFWLAVGRMWVEGSGVKQ